jgi:hypothetical protein
VSRLKWGVAREPICRALIERARGLLDKHAVMRKPSLEGVQAMLLLVSMLSSHSWIEEPDRMALLESEQKHESADDSPSTSVRHCRTQ